MGCMRYSWVVGQLRNWTIRQLGNEAIGELGGLAMKKLGNHYSYCALPAKESGSQLCHKISSHDIKNS